MEAKDTVMGKEQWDNIFYRGSGTLGGICKKQAQISFKAGYETKCLEMCGHAIREVRKAGIKEVVDWMNEAMAFTNSENLPPNILRIDFKYDKWQAKLKEWGL